MNLLLKHGVNDKLTRLMTEYPDYVLGVDKSAIYLGIRTYAGNLGRYAICNSPHW